MPPLRRPALFWIPVLVATNLLVGWSVASWQAGRIAREADGSREALSSQNLQIAELQDAVAQLQRKGSAFTVLANQDGGGMTVAIKPLDERVPPFSLHFPAAWGLAGVSGLTWSGEGSEKILGGFAVAPQIRENVDLPYNGELVIRAVDVRFASEPGVIAAAGTKFGQTGEVAWFYQTLINGRLACKDNDRLCREAKQQFDAEAGEVVRSLSSLSPAP